MTQIKVGAFLLAGLIVLLTTIFMLGSNKSMFQEVIILKSSFDSVQGLNKGAVVSLSGVKIGNIESLDFDEQKNLVEVYYRVDAEFKQKIKKDSRIEIRTQGALGDKFLYITPGKSESHVSNGDRIESDYGNDLISVISKRGNETENVFEILKDIKKITGSLAENNKVDKIAGNLERASSNLVVLTDELNKTIKGGSINRSTEKLENILSKIEKGEGTLGALINDKSIHERIKNILGAGQKDAQIKSILKSSVEE